MTRFVLNIKAGFLLTLLVLPLSSFGGFITGAFLFPGTWYADRQGVPTTIDISRFGRATVNDESCSWKETSFKSYVDAIVIRCPDKMPL